MAQYDVYRNADAETAKEFPYLVDVQADLLRHLDTRLVVPLGWPSKNFLPVLRLTPQVEVQGERLLFLVNHTVSIPRVVLGPLVDSLKRDRVELLGAIDFLLT